MNSPSPSSPATLSARLLAMPKAEVHVHLEGSMEARELERLALDAGEKLPRPAESLFQFTALADFLEFLDWSCGLVRTREQLAGIAYAFSQRLAGDGVGYADAIVNPAHWPAWRARMGEMIEALDGGFRAAEDPELVKRLADLRIPLGVCPGSNLALGVYRSMALHPIERLRQAGVQVSVNTDDPALFNTSIVREYARCVDAYGWDDRVLAEVAATSIDASFAPAPILSALKVALVAWRSV